MSRMDMVLQHIYQAVREAQRPLNDGELQKVLHTANKGRSAQEQCLSKKMLLAALRKLLDAESAMPLWMRNGTEHEYACMLATLTTKRRRSASGVSTITVLTKPWPCSSNCLYCPNDLRMPKSYLSDEPACQRAEQAYFDPYIQVIARLETLRAMGHATDKIELIILGGTWSDYPRVYQYWYIKELFAALNDYSEDRMHALEMRKCKQEHYTALHAAHPVDSESLASHQDLIDGVSYTYNAAYKKIYAQSAYALLETQHQADKADVLSEHLRNETSRSRVVGLVVETRPDLISEQELIHLRTLGCTKIQMGIQTLDDKILALNTRTCDLAVVARAFALLRRFGFKIHVHMMLNLLGSTPERDVQTYQKLVTDPRFKPDEVKLYPCVLVAHTGLYQAYAQGLWKPYSEETLIDLLVRCVQATPEYLRISRMVRDISAHDILAGSTTANLRQLVEERLNSEHDSIHEIRFREIATRSIDTRSAELSVVSYETATTQEYFYQWLAPTGHILGFLRLSLPQSIGDQPKMPAMIREVHVYGMAQRLTGSSDPQLGATQHQGLGRRLIHEACMQAQAEGFASIQVISAVGTREYYRSVGFDELSEDGLYQQMSW